MKHKMIILFFVFLVSFIVFKQVTVSEYVPILKQRTEEPQKIVVSNSRTMEPQAMQVRTSSTVRGTFRESDFCSNREYKNISEISLYWINRCPEKPVVTAHQLGHLGNQIWEYASVWSVAKTTDHEPFIPNCMIQTLQKVFQNLTAIPPLKYIEHCPIEFDYLWTVEFIKSGKGNIILPIYTQLPRYIIPHLKEVLQLFKFHDHLTEKSQNILRTASKGVSDIVYVGVHVRRIDYELYLKLFFFSNLVDRDFFVRQMDYFRIKYSRVIFIIVSDDPDWCDRELSANDTVVVRGNSPEQDLSLLASCNHSIVDYGTFGMWSAMMAGGETLLYKLPSGVGLEVAELMPEWYLVT